MNRRVKKLISFVTRKNTLEYSVKLTDHVDSNACNTSSCIFSTSKNNINKDQTTSKQQKSTKFVEKADKNDVFKTKIDDRSDNNIKKTTASCYEIEANVTSSSSPCDVINGGSGVVPRRVTSVSRKNRDSIGQYSVTSSVGSKDGRGISFDDETPRLSDEVELADDQKAELKQAFSMFEKTGKGRIQARDLGELLRCLGWNPSEQDLEEARHELELSTRGTISFSEVEAYIARRGGIYYGNNAEEDIMVAFQVLDKTGSGKITVEDFRHFMTTMGERLSHDEVEELIACSTRGGKDYIEYRDLVHAVQQSPT